MSHQKPPSLLTENKLFHGYPDLDKNAINRSGAEKRSTGIMGTEGVLEPEGSVGDLAVWLSSPLTVGQDQGNQQTGELPGAMGPTVKPPSFSRLLIFEVL